LPRGGSIWNDTANVTLDKEYARIHHGAKPGDYVMFSLADTGEGMDKSTVDHIFEPFFTTKGVGKGTGLGLAVVYGIVKQHDGYIWVNSVRGKGTTSTVYLPRVRTEAEAIAATPTETPRGTETILLVEDEPAALEVSRRILEGHGYTALTASGPDEAEAIMAERGEEVALVVTDVVMPRMDGPNLYKKLALVRPGLRALYVSGYASDAVVSHGVPAADGGFLQKPFEPAALARKVREVLDK